MIPYIIIKFLFSNRHSYNSYTDLHCVPSNLITLQCVLLAVGWEAYSGYNFPCPLKVSRDY